MKKMLGLLLCSLLFSCSFEKTLDSLTRVSVYDHINDTEMEFQSFTAAGYWIAENIEYKEPDPYIWQSPRQTEDTLKGMCVDTSILLLWYAVMKFDYDYESCYLCGIEQEDGSKHMMVYIDGKLYESQEFWFYEDITMFNIIKKYYLQEALDIVYYQYGNRSCSTEEW